MVRYALSVALIVSLARPSAADIYSYTDKEGVMHFTNVKPKGKDRKKWKRVGDLSPQKSEKPAASRGSCKRCDKVPAKDNSAERFKRFDPWIARASSLYQIPEPLIRAVIKVESDYDPRVVSAVGARGLMQLMPSAAKDMGVTDPHDPAQCILGGTRLLRVLANRYNGDLVKTIAAYHAGPGSLAKYKDEVPPYANTRKYLRMVLRWYNKYSIRAAN